MTGGVAVQGLALSLVLPRGEGWKRQTMESGSPVEHFNLQADSRTWKLTSAELDGDVDN